MSIVQDPEHSDGAPTIEDTGIREKDIVVAYEHSGYKPGEITQLYPDPLLGDVHRALAYYYTVGQNYLKIGRSPAAVSDGDGREFVTDFPLTSVRQYQWGRV
ncbi:DUF433 domain-containing protein [Natrarchaeobius halalkaliphilus]|uniref:DUF433 domain-containing protein n=1 Tax=Natrarchaeobius halalkaliphilus TaxID=1679091 RepID=A0A3N6MB85_9EURY|nr:DUF433 domain-containing protein [Natrarchaeobius halalkaliphilus]RQG92721.1 DUF433 domain-containing protein [Natrarchaeobius halalkaliphilus]